MHGYGDHIWALSNACAAGLKEHQLVNRDLGNIPVPKTNYQDPVLREALEDTEQWCSEQQLNAQKALAYAQNVHLLQEYERRYAQLRREAMRAWKAETPSPTKRAMAAALGVTESVVTRSLYNKKYK